MLSACSPQGAIFKTAPQNEVAELYAYEGSGPWWTCDAAAVVPPRLAQKGIASSEGCEPTTLPKILRAAASAAGDMPALKTERPCPPLGEGNRAPPALPETAWTTWTFKQYSEEVELAARGLLDLGFQPFDAVNIWGFNAPEWAMAMFAAGFAGGKVAGLYPTDTGATAAYKVLHSGGSVVVLEDRGKLKKLLQGLAEMGPEVERARGKLKAIIVYGADFQPDHGETVDVPGQSRVPLLSWKQLLDQARASAVPASEIDKRVEAALPGHCAALIYTSGTTGMPKAVMVSHDNIVFLSTAVLETLKNACGFGSGGQERVLSYLPLSHVAGMMVDLVTPVSLGARERGKAHTTLYFARGYDLKAGSLKDRLQVCKPTIFIGVPLVWEKIADKVRAIGAATTGPKKAIATWAKRLGLEHGRSCQLGGSGASPFGYGLARKLVLSKVRATLGLDCLKYAFTGAAPIREDTLEYFAQLGIEINEIYGMSESSGGMTWSTHQAHLWGSCGYELASCECRVFKVHEADLNEKAVCPRAPDMSAGEEFQGEICARSRGIMMGYLANPDFGEDHVRETEKKTAETIDKDGWLHSGDKGLCTASGMFKITGRYKELIIGDGGENIAPVPIEDLVKRACDGIGDIMMVGDKRKYNVALVTLKAVGANGEVPGTDELDAGARLVNPAVATITAALDDEAWIGAVRDAIQAANSNSKVCLNNAYTIQKFCILPTNFSEEAGLLTPTKKLKRKAAEDQYKSLIDRMYSTEEAGPYVRYR